MASRVNEFTKNILQTNIIELWTNHECDTKEDGEWISPERFLELYPKLVAIAIEREKAEKPKKIT